MKGTKHDQDKPILSLLDASWLLGVGDVLTFGAKKYAAHNWREGLPHSRTISAALRHILAFNDGEDFDPETGLSHLLHASCCLMFAYGMRDKEGADDRFTAAKKETSLVEDWKKDYFILANGLLLPYKNIRECYADSRRGYWVVFKSGIHTVQEIHIGNPSADEIARLKEAVKNFEQMLRDNHDTATPRSTEPLDP